VGENPVTAAVNVTGAPKFEALGVELSVVVEAHGLTICVTVLDTLPELLASPLYVAIIV
jgi:hypothetical protein